MRFHGPLVRYVKLWVALAPGMPGTFSPPPLVSDPDMHHGTSVTHVPWCMPGSLTSGFLWSLWRGNVSGIPGACATHNFTYLVRGPCHQKWACCTCRGSHAKDLCQISPWFASNKKIREINHKNGNCCNIGETRSHIVHYTISDCFYDPHFLSCCRFRSINSHSEPPFADNLCTELNYDDDVIPKTFCLNAVLCIWYGQGRRSQATEW